MLPLKAAECVSASLNFALMLNLIGLTGRTGQQLNLSTERPVWCVSDQLMGHKAKGSCG